MQGQPRSASMHVRPIVGGVKCTRLRVGRSRTLPLCLEVRTLVGGDDCHRKASKPNTGQAGHLTMRRNNKIVRCASLTFAVRVPTHDHCPAIEAGHLPCGARRCNTRIRAHGQSGQTSAGRGGQRRERREEGRERECVSGRESVCQRERVCERECVCERELPAPLPLPNLIFNLGIHCVAVKLMASNLDVP